MNRYPLWKYLLVTAVLALGLLYTLPNFFGRHAGGTDFDQPPFARD